ncbi:hypothetical protein F5X98DRAFT_84816 [Xylaria grammica]|nr:hypothetical protein F5X98DRAFT_84816 [Xylaria grammica]
MRHGPSRYSRGTIVATMFLSCTPACRLFGSAVWHSLIRRLVGARPPRQTIFVLPGVPGTLRATRKGKFARLGHYASSAQLTVYTGCSSSDSWFTAHLGLTKPNDKAPIMPLRQRNYTLVSL